MARPVSGFTMQQFVVAVFIAIAVIKVILLVVIGPIYGGDLPSYEGFAQAMLSSTA